MRVPLQEGGQVAFERRHRRRDLARSSARHFSLDFQRGGQTGRDIHAPVACGHGNDRSGVLWRCIASAGRYRERVWGDPEAIAKAAITVGAPLLALIGVGGRRRRLRNDIKDNLALVEEIEKHDLLRNHTLASGWLQGRVALDVARLSGQRLGTPKAPVPKGSVAMALILALPFALWTYLIDKDGFVWYSVFPGVVAALLLVSTAGMFMNRELPPDETAHLPPGAVLAPTETASEQVATSVALAASGGVDGRFSDDGQVGVVLRFMKLQQLGQYESAIHLADENWIQCRVRSWLWNNRNDFGEDVEALEVLAEAMLSQRHSHEEWRNFVDVESRSFMDAWGPLDLAQYGAASRRRRVARDYDLVILAPVGTSGGYFVMAATAIPDAMPFLVVRRNGAWLVANHVGTAPPTVGWPPAWWMPSDPAVDALSDT